MQTTTTPTPDTATVVKAEFAAMLDRCEAAGLHRKDARDTLSFLLLTESLERGCQAERDRITAAAQTPAGQALQKAFELHQANDELRRLGVKPDDTVFNLACEAYLRCAYAAGPGDTLEIHGWAKPRTVRLKTFRLRFDNADRATDAFMWFEGDAVRNCPKNSSHHGCPLSTSAYKI